MNAEAFFDSNILLYLLSSDATKAAHSEELLAGGGTISVQVFNEIASVASKKYKLPWPVIKQYLYAIRANVGIVPLTVAIHDHGLELIGRYKLSVYDSMIIAAALSANCKTLYSEDMHDGLMIEGLKIRNPYLST